GRDAVAVGRESGSGRGQEQRAGGNKQVPAIHADAFLQRLYRRPPPQRGQTRAMMSEKRREEMARKIAQAGRFRDFQGATVLEIGADKDGFSARMLAEAGAARV